ncbi:AP-2 complex subunit beta isoform A [Neolecta irregularis DAH-3]|uniref:AP-2 complex subunit beta isoform A n=1 Tax=Neolecta irregularis (strain DAH-3) TaxID=1198029 RepID=A0A1U7LL51_NEOID|nr:AP-2 complex subunit beta isoform A [Neolecta irregularis DAH-3]|eukprot:OLL23385.1 AP-2 complex subunit beta isoform A [Neolecta irregularis DAH-3]
MISNYPSSSLIYQGLTVINFLNDVYYVEIRLSQRLTGQFPRFVLLLSKLIPSFPMSSDARFFARGKVQELRNELQMEKKEKNLNKKRTVLKKVYNHLNYLIDGIYCREYDHVK